MTAQPQSLPAVTLSERLRAGLGPRATGIVVALLLEALLLLLLLSLGRVGPSGKDEITFVDFKAIEASDEAAADPSPEPEPRAEAEQVIGRAAPREAEEAAVPAARPAEAPRMPVVTLPTAPTARQPDPRYGVGPRPIQNPPPAGPAFGPANSGSAQGDSARVGTAPNGEPMYAAAWYRKPYDDELRGYLSTATGPGWGLIACRTAPDYRVEDCVGLEEYPRGSMIVRSILAAAWQFKVRPPRIGGRPQIGEWVRIRIDYDLRPAG